MEEKSILFYKKNIIKIERNPGIDLLRIIAMFAIVLHHVLYQGKVLSKYKYYNSLNLIDTSCYFHISNFGMISGIVGSKTNKYSNLIYIWFWTLFYSVGIHFIFKIFKHNCTQKYKSINFFLPVIFEKYWYITKYFGMYLFIPLINKGLSNIKQNELKTIVLSINLILFTYKDLILDKDDPFVVQSGYSPLGLLIFYLTGNYLGKYYIVQNKNKNFFFYLICIISYFSSSYLCYYLSFYDNKNINMFIYILKKLFTLRINSLSMMIQSISLILIFTQIKYNKYISKIVTFLGPLTLGIYLIHCHKYMFINVIYKLFQNYDNILTFKTIFYLVILKSIGIFFICIILDYFRFLIFKALKIRNICNFIDKKLYSIS